MTRRDLLVAGGGATILAGCAPLAARIAGPQKPVAEVKDPERRVLDRLGFGPSAPDLERLRALGPDGYLKAQLEAKEEEPTDLKLLLSRIDALKLHSDELRDLPEDAALHGLQTAAVLRAVRSPNGLQERMAEFWSDHLAIYARKGWASFRLGTDQSDVIRAHALGSFPEMLRASARSPAMLVFLDNPFSNAGHPNENYARELMELHSLGVDGGYSQQDVMEVARCFSGWGIERRFGRPRGRFRFDEERHDDGTKVVLGHTIPAGGGEKDGERVLQILSKHPATGRHLARKLSMRFLGEESPKRQASVERAYAQHDGQIRPMLEALFANRAVLDAPPILRRPFDFVTATLRGLGATTDGGKPLLERLAGMGQAPYEWPMPDGYPVDTPAWTGTMLARWQFVDDLANDRIGGTSVPADADALAYLAPGEMWR